MPERFLDDYLTIREARPPHRHRSWVDRWAWVLPVGLCLGFGAGLLVEKDLTGGFGFLAAGAVIAWVFRDVR